MNNMFELKKKNENESMTGYKYKIYKVLKLKM